MKLTKIKLKRNKKSKKKYKPRSKKTRWSRGGLTIQDEQGNQLSRVNEPLPDPVPEESIPVKTLTTTSTTSNEKGLGNSHELGTLVGDGINYSMILMSNFLSGISTRKNEFANTYNDSIKKYKGDFLKSVNNYEEIHKKIDNNSKRKLITEGDTDTFGIHSIFTEITDTINNINDPKEKLMLVWFITSYTMSELTKLYKSVRMN